MHRLKFIFLLFFFFLPVNWAAARASVEELSSAKQTAYSIDSTDTSKEDLLTCKDEELGVRLLCNPDWELQTDKETILIIISSDPAVTLTIARQKTPLISVEQLSNTLLTELGQYEEGFDTERIHLAGQEAIKVKGFYKSYPQIRLLDYYLIHNSSLYMVLFSVNPKEKWDDYKFLIKRITESLSFLE